MLFVDTCSIIKAKINTGGDVMKKAVFIILRILGAALLVLMIGWFLAPFFRWGTYNIGNVAGISL